MFKWKSYEEKFLDGQLLFVPEELKKKVEGESFRVERRELIYLIWAAIKSTPAERKGGWKRVHHKRFNYGSSFSTGRSVVLWLAEHGFVELDKTNSYYADPKNGFPKKYKLIQKPSPTLIELKNKTLFDGPEPYTQDDDCCRYTREMLDRLEVDMVGVQHELGQVIREYHQLVNQARNREKNHQYKEKTRENRDFIESLYTFGLPLLHLVNKRGSIKRGKKGNRLFSPMTNVKKTFRKFFTLEGDPLVWLDMQAAHPTLLGNLADDQNLVNDCLSDAFYGRIMGDLAVDRDTAKKRYMAWAYDRHRPESRLTTFMFKHYSRAAEYVIDHKREKHQRFSWEMQRQEADIFIDTVYGQLAKETIPAITVHDCLGTTATHKQQVRKKIEQELREREHKAEIKEEEPPIDTI